MARIMLASLLAAMGATQLADPRAFRAVLRTYGLRHGAVALPAAELAVAAGLLTRRRAAGDAGVAIAAVWTVLAAQALTRGVSVPNCGCFGSRLARPLRSRILLEDLLFLGLAWRAR